MMNLVGSSTQNRMHLDHQALPSPHSCPSSTPSWSSWPPSSFAFRTTVHVQPDHQALPLLRSCPCSTPSLTAALSPSCPSHQSTGFRLTQVVWEKYLSIMELFMDFFHFHASTSLHVRVWATETCWVMTWPTAASSSSTSSAQCPSGRNFYIKGQTGKEGSYPALTPGKTFRRRWALHLPGPQASRLDPCGTLTPTNTSGTRMAKPRWGWNENSDSECLGEIWMNTSTIPPWWKLTARCQVLGLVWLKLNVNASGGYK